MSKDLATRLKETLPDLIQNAYVKEQVNWRRIISDILEISNTVNLRGYGVTVDIEKAFDTLSHSFLLACLKNLNLVIIL